MKGVGVWRRGGGRETVKSPGSVLEPVNLVYQNDSYSFLAPLFDHWIISGIPSGREKR